MVGPEREIVLNPGRAHLHTDLAPIYALYREFKNSNSAYYRLLCLYKIMEGILGVLRKNARTEYAKVGLKFSVAKETVPDHPDIPAHLRCFIGRTIKDFYDNLWTSPAQGDLLVRQLECTNLSGLLRDGSRPWP